MLPVSQPWFDEAVGTSRWTGTPLADLLNETTNGSCASPTPSTPMCWSSTR
jgi:hypothetical protein